MFEKDGKYKVLYTLTSSHPFQVRGLERPPHDILMRSKAVSANGNRSRRAYRSQFRALYGARVIDVKDSPQYRLHGTA